MWLVGKGPLWFMMRVVYDFFHNSFLGVSRLIFCLFCSMDDGDVFFSTENLTLFLRSSVSLAPSYASGLWPWSPSGGCRFHSDLMKCFVSHDVDWWIMWPDVCSAWLLVAGLAEPGGPFLASDPKRGIFSTESGCFVLYIAKTAVIQPSPV